MAEDENVLSAYQSDPAYLAHYTKMPDAGSIVASAIDWAREQPRKNYQFAVVLQSSGEVIGCAGLRQRGYPAGDAEIGVELSPVYWRRGFAKEVLSALLAFGQSNLALTTFWAETTGSNVPAQSLVDRFGFSQVSTSTNAARFRLRIGEKSLFE